MRLAIPFLLVFAAHSLFVANAMAQDTLVTSVPRQPLEASVKRLREAMRFLGEPVDDSIEKTFARLENQSDDATVVAEIQKTLDPLCLAVVSINPESRVKVASATQSPTLVEKGWRTFLIKVVNEAGVTAPLRCSSPQSQSMVRQSTSAADPA